MASNAWNGRDHFFRWHAASVILIVLVTLYGLTVPLNIWLGRHFSLESQQQMSHRYYWGALWDALVAALCFGAWRLMAGQSRADFLRGACAVTVALIIVTRTHVAQLRREPSSFFIVEAALEMLPMMYCILFAIRKSRGDDPF
jgi:hypothetical protein